MVRTLLLAVAAAAVAAGCSKEAAVEGPPTATGGDEVAILRSFPASPSGEIRTETKAVLRDAKAWAVTWALASAHLAPLPRAPAVDFAKEMVAVAALGEKPTAGWSVQIVGARMAEGRLRILYAVHEPSAAEAAAKVVTRPWHAVVLPASDLPVEWVVYTPPARPAKR